jgi:type IV pilus assembly protein PilY1
MKSNSTDTCQEVSYMKQGLTTLRKATEHVLVCLFAAGTSAAVFAAPGEISKTPLYLTTQVQPNILMVVDDSGSMNWENLLTNGAIAAHGVSNTPENNSGTRYLDWTPDTNQERREWCVGYNAMAYNPARTYTPWVGKDKDGNAFQNSNYSSAYSDPYYKSGAENLGNKGDGAFYYPWVDANGDGRYQDGECKIDDSDIVKLKDLTSVERQNFANWFSFYRKREYVSKRALSEIISNSKARVGLATLHNNNSVGTLVKDVDDITVPIDTSAQTSKNALLKNLFRINSNNGTPLRTRLQQAGKYYDKADTPADWFFGINSPSSPIHSVANGGECQQNYTVLMSDGYWNGNSPGVGNTDGDNNSAFDGGVYADSYSNTLADVAMYYYEKDLATTYADKLPGSTIDPNKAQHMVTYTVALGVNGSLTGPGPGGGPNDPKAASFPWTQPVANTNTTVDDMVHAAYNGRGEYLSANNTDELIAALGRAFLSIDERQGSSSAVSFNSTRVDAGTFAFQAKFDSSGWHGDLLAYEIEDGLDASGNPDSSETAGEIGALQWSAATKLDARNLSSAPREIVTYNGTTGVPFRAPSNYVSPGTNELKTAQLADLMKNANYPIGTANATERAANQTYLNKIVEYFRGADTNEGVSVGQFRPRFGKRLGDIISSSPAFSGPPASRYPDTIESSVAADSYDKYVKDNTSRAPLVFVGANDGMLHAFKGNDGEEAFAYIPGLVYSADSSQGMHYMAEQNYGHQPYVDGSPTVADVYIGGSWKTYLVGAMGGGAKGVFVLDVTDPSKLKESFASSVVKFEFTDNNLGYTFSKPQVGRLNNGKWAAIFGNGYNSDPTGDGRAKLYILYLDGSGHLVLDTKKGSISNNSCADSGSDCNGLSTPFILDHTGDARIDRVYAGDLHGNMWAFDLSSSSTSNWKSAYLDSGDPKPLFRACSADTCTTATRQPITSMPVIGVHPTRRSADTWPNLMVYFGTGQYLATNDNFTTGTQSAYGIWDAGAANIDQPRTKLVQQTISNSGGTRDLTSNTVNYTTGETSSKYGWYEDFPDTGERTVIEMLVDRDVLFYATLVPENTQCSPGGTGYLMFVDRMTGGKTSFAVLDLDNNKIFDDAIVNGKSLGAIPGGLSKISSRLFTADSLGQINSYQVQTGEAKPSRRTSWSVIH